MSCCVAVTHHNASHDTSSSYSDIVHCCLLSLKSGCCALLLTSRYTMSLPPDIEAIDPERRLTNEEELPPPWLSPEVWRVCVSERTCVRACVWVSKHVCVYVCTWIVKIINLWPYGSHCPLAFIVARKKVCDIENLEIWPWGGKGGGRQVRRIMD